MSEKISNFDGYVHVREDDLKKFPEPSIVDMSGAEYNVAEDKGPVKDEVYGELQLTTAQACEMADVLRKIDEELRRCATAKFSDYHFNEMYSSEALLKNLCEIMYSYPGYHTLPKFNSRDPRRY